MNFVILRKKCVICHSFQQLNLFFIPPIWGLSTQNNIIGNWQHCLPGGDQLLLCHPLHLRDVLQDVRPRHRLLLHPAVQPVRLLRGDLLDPGDGAHHVQRDAAPGHVRPPLHPPTQGLQGTYSGTYFINLGVIAGSYHGVVSILGFY
jgi:hypothetical protein